MCIFTYVYTYTHIWLNTCYWLTNYGTHSWNKKSLIACNSSFGKGGSLVRFSTFTLIILKFGFFFVFWISQYFSSHLLIKLSLSLLECSNSSTLSSSSDILPFSWQLVKPFTGFFLNWTYYADFQIHAVTYHINFHHLPCIVTSAIININLGPCMLNYQLIEHWNSTKGSQNSFWGWDIETYK